MKIHLDFNNTAEMLAYSKFIVDAATPIDVKDSQSYKTAAKAWMEKAIKAEEENKQLKKLLERAYTRLRMSDPEGKTANKEEVKTIHNIPKNVLETPVSNLYITARSENCLKSENIETIGQLIKHTRNELLKISNLGSKSIKDIEEQLEKQFGLTLELA